MPLLKNSFIFRGKEYTHQLIKLEKTPAIEHQFRELYKANKTIELIKKYFFCQKVTVKKDGKSPS